MYRTNILPYRPVFTGNLKRKPQVDNKEQINILAEKARAAMAERVEKEVPENGKFAKLSVSWSMPETLNKAVLAVEADAINSMDLRRFAVGSYRKGSDNIILGYLLKGTKKEILDFLNNPENTNKIILTAQQLSDSVDKHYSELY